jgi:D-alanine-D-alanine ligase
VNALVAYLDDVSAPGDGYAQRQADMAALATALRAVGLDARLLDVGPSPGRLTSALEEQPSLVFNYAERVATGGHPAWFVPDVCDAAGAPCTGSSGSSLRLMVDKHRTKLACADGIRTPASEFIDRWPVPPDHRARLAALAPPLLVKPNFEGRSVGISDETVATSLADAERLIARQLGQFPEGVLVERFVEGSDVTVGFLEASDRVRVLPPVLYEPRRLAPSRYGMFDERAKNAPELQAAQRERRHATCPAPLDDAVLRDLEAQTVHAARALGIMGLGRADYRVAPAVGAYFLEMNALPDIDGTSGFAIACSTAGLELAAVVRHVVASAGAEAGAGRLDLGDRLW